MATARHIAGCLRSAACQHWLLLLLLVLPIHWVVYQSDAGTVVPFLVLPVMAVLVGAMVRLRHVWLGRWLRNFRDHAHGQSPGEPLVS
jgi:hypothetical protein